MNVENAFLHREPALPPIAALELTRPRSVGRLSGAQIDWCRRNGIPLAFDPVQGGWVPSDCEDDLSTTPSPEGDQEDFRFRAWSREDAPSYARMLSSERLWHYLPEGYAGPIDAATAADLIELGEESHHSVSAVEKDGVAIGQARLRFDSPGSAEISYWLGEEYWGKGYGSRLVVAYCDQCFQDRPELEHLFARVHKDHRASQRILEKAGFTHFSDDGDWMILERWR